MASPAATRMRKTKRCRIGFPLWTGGPATKVKAQDGRAAAQNPDLFLRRHHAARWCGGAPRLQGRRGDRGPPIVPRRARSLSQGGGRRRRRGSRLHAGSAAVRRSRGREREAASHLRQYPRDRRLVEGRQSRRPENCGADRGGGRAGARLSFRHPQQRRRDAALRQGRAGDRGGQAAQGPSRPHRADQGAGRRCCPRG